MTRIEVTTENEVMVKSGPAELPSGSSSQCFQIM